MLTSLEGRPTDLPGKGRSWLAWPLALMLWLTALPPVAAAAEAPPPPQVGELLRLLDDPGVRSWLEQQRAQPGAHPATISPDPAAAARPGSPVAERVAAIRAHLLEVVQAVPQVPGEIARTVARVGGELSERGWLGTLILFAGLIALGFGVEAVYWRITAHWRQALAMAPQQRVDQRIRLVGQRLLYGLGWSLSFVVGTFGVFLLFSWPLVVKDIILSYLAAFLVVQLTRILARLLFSPRNPGVRLLGVDDAAAEHWNGWITWLVGFFAFGYATVILTLSLDMAPPVSRLLAYSLALILLVMTLVAIWTRPAIDADRDDDGRIDEDADPLAIARARRISWGVSLVMVLLWISWVIQAHYFFWLLAVAAGLPALVRVSDEAVKRLLTPRDGEDASLAISRPFRFVCLERGLRAAWIVGAVLLLAKAWDVDLVDISQRANPLARLVSGALTAVVILLVADFLWRLLRTFIDMKLEEAKDLGETGTDEARRRSRLRTLLPILRNLLFIIFLVMAVLMALSAMGVEIAPLIAGAGVVGVAIGFGSQTLVKDFISGFFYLLDDAFRIGEYIVSGNYKGTVESFSLRSVKLRHQRGPLYTVPFGSLGAIQNMSRDWVIDKIAINVDYDTDVDKVKKIIKKIGEELAANEEFAPDILQTLKMQGIDAFGDFAILIRMKMMTKPGKQFVIRRRAFGMIKKAFAENGIKIAMPTVNVAGGEGGHAAAAKGMLDAMSEAKPAE